VAEDADSDPLIYTGRFFPATGKACVDIMNDLEANYSKIVTPFIICQGGIDKLCDPRGSF